MALYVGTSGWAYAEWREGFYPERLPQARFLEHYASRFGACEVNATFYKLHSPETFARWRAATPDAFRFAVKAHRRLTHARRLVTGERWREFAARFLASLQGLEERLACMLVQFPPHLERDTGALEAVLAALAGGPPPALEFRHPSWATAEVEALAESYGAAICYAEAAGEVPSALPPGPFAYVRLRAERYGPAERDDWLALLEREAASRDVYAFAKHEGVPAGDPFTGVGLAEWLVAQTRGGAVSAPGSRG